MIKPVLRSDKPLTIRPLRRKLRTASRLTAHDYDTIVVRYALSLLPIRHHHSPVRRLTTRTVRSMALRVGRVLHRMTYAARASLQCLSNVWLYATRPDLHVLKVMEQPLEGLPAAELFVAAAKPSLADPEPEINDPAPAVFRFPRGSVLLSLANSWDYLDYRYLYRACKHDGLRFISIIYDVIGMELPFSTPSPPHIYHRHWVEIGHCADALLAISKFSADQYDKYISKPNDLSPRLSHAPLPSFLRERSAEIGTTPVASLAGRSFVMFCSTIETRKNHQLLLHLWDRLKEVFDPEQLPVLVFVGKWGWGTETVRLLSERNYRLRGHLQILDQVSDAELIWLYRNARFTVFPALSEGYGLAAAESLSFNTPVVVATCPALIEATEGLMPALDPLDIVGWFDELQALIRDDCRLEALRAAAARYRGPDYATFAETICQLARAAEPALQGMS
jgi:glycosyltransferase involved in cell wall biosynthesis